MENLRCTGITDLSLNFVQVIIEVNDCALGRMGESQEEDRRMIADLVLQEMETRCGLMPQELMVSQSTLSTKAYTFVAQAQCRPPGAPPIKPTPSTTVTGT